MKKLHWQAYDVAPSRHPYRDSAIIYGVLAGVVVAIGAATGASMVKTVIVAVAVFVAATFYSWWRLREKLREPEESER